MDIYTHMCVFSKEMDSCIGKEKNIKNCTQQCLNASVKPPGWKHLLDSQNAHFFF